VLCCSMCVCWRLARDGFRLIQFGRSPFALIHSSVYTVYPNVLVNMAKIGFFLNTSLYKPISVFNTS
jgi:hypothetical protein